ncbi:MAG: helix-hairpin-helix domain-containing protein [Atopobiaceae bacterium]|nr:helix-hairpin-helix domain-containing protein [Atopobiaceae bacterium]
MALVTLSCAAGGLGAVWQSREATSIIERRAPAEAGDTSGEVADKQLTQPDEKPQPAIYVVHVDGAVASPGVVTLEGKGLRVFDAVTKAGGLLDDADTTSVNLAEPLSDGAKIHIPSEGEALVAEQGVPAAGQHETMGATGSAEAVSLVNINTATSEELQVLSGVGEATATAIIREREANGPFAVPEDLMRVSGIGEKKFAKVRDQICV